MNLPKGRILVTGGAGFIGSALVNALNEIGVEDILISDLLDRSEKWRNLTPLRFTEYIEADQLLDKVVKKDPSLNEIGLVLHLGACSSTMETDAGYLVRNNYQYTASLAHWALDQDIRFVYASSAATYGDGEQGMNDKSDDLVAFRPLNMYGYSKHMFDLHAQRNKWLNNITGLKYFNVYGPNEDHKGEMRSLVNKAYHQISQTGKIKLFRSHKADYKDGEQQRDFLYIKDAVAMTLHLAATPTATGLYNIGSGQANTWVSLANAIFSAMAMEPQIEFIDIPESIREKYQYFTQADISKLREAGYEKQFTPMSEAVKDYVQKYLAKEKRLGD
ncbi:MAG: ADP-glyceromanno-heptose 6-epimerase [Opitutae bacterium]|jgi:ADP-L-glycero-D-manno-heptose 6-epimerase|nr:ADP-glyceromanno-heptose 6-epimerase [Opitutae bacterium]MBT7854365.1 ADP-glyceromanno-heptose 6-epimerase [Opitutae bacterium]